MPDRFSCKQCGKQYPRQSGLTKHMKSHDRAFKCAKPGCIYVQKGFPTAQDLVRHRNDRHSSNPVTLPCPFEGCSHEAKRESNLKQHMERVHRLHYEKSRSGKPKTFSPSIGLKTTPVNVVSHSSAMRESLGMSPGEDVMPFPGGLDDAGLQTLGSQPQAETPSQVNQSPAGYGYYLPWQSPMARVKNNINVMETIVEKIPQPNVPVDPVLLAEDSSGSTYSAGYLQQACPIDEEQSAQHSSAATRQGAAAMSQPSAASASQVRRDGPVKRQDVGENGDGDDTRPPPKRLRPVSKDEIQDHKLPCPFHIAHPAVYDRHNGNKYDPCHTLNKSISAVVYATRSSCG